MKAILRSGFLALILTFSPACSENTELYEDGLAAYQRGDYATALKFWRPLAEQGFADAQYSLGVSYDYGLGVPQDYAEAVKWYRNAAEQGFADAQYNLGYMYATGEGVPPDFGEAANWFLMAAEQGHADAQKNLDILAEQGVAEAQNTLGLLYFDGHGVTQDFAEAAKWYRRAAEEGNAAAQSNLGVMYEFGLGVPQDYVQAHKWFDLAAAQGTEKAQKYRDKAARDMTPNQIAEAQRIALEWRAQHKGDADAQLQMEIRKERRVLPASDRSTPNIKSKAVKTIRIGRDGKPIPE